MIIFTTEYWKKELFSIITHNALNCYLGLQTNHCIPPVSYPRKGVHLKQKQGDIRKTRGGKLKTQVRKWKTKKQKGGGIIVPIVISGISIAALAAGGYAVFRSEKQSNMIKERTKINIPFYLPSNMLNKYSVKTFNWFYYNRIIRKQTKSTVSFDSFFFPLDSLKNWNKIYGRKELNQM